MNSTSHPAERRDVRTILGTGLALGIGTALVVVAFSLLSRALRGGAEVVVQAVIVLVGGAMVAYLPARAVRPHSADAIGWSAFIGVISAWTFTALDIVVLRPLGLYSWRWDAIGGGSGWWYIPVWWMGAVLLSWVGALVYAMLRRAGGEASPAAPSRR